MQNDDLILKLSNFVTDNMKTLLNLVQSLERRVAAIEGKVNMENDVKSKISPIIIRYSRYLDKKYKIETKGGITYAFQIDYTKCVANVGISVCSKNENFKKCLGRDIAEIRLKTDPISFAYVTPSRVPLVYALWNHLNYERPNVSTNNMKALKAINYRKDIS